MLQQRLSLQLRWESLSSLLVVGGLGVALGYCTVAALSLPRAWTPLVIAAMLAPFIAMIAGTVRKLLLIVIMLDLPLRLDIELGHQPEFGAMGILTGWSVSATTLALIGLYSLWLTEAVTRQRYASQVHDHVSRPALAYLMCIGLSVIGASRPIFTAYELFLLLQMFFLFRYLVGTVHTRQEVFFIVTALLVGLTCESVIMIVTKIVGHGFSFAGISSNYPDLEAGQRTGGTLGHPNIAATYMVLIIPAALSTLWTRAGVAVKGLAFLGAGLGTVALLFTLSRGGWLALLIATFLLLRALWQRGWLPPPLLIILTGVALVVIAASSSVILARFTADDHGSSYSRIPLIQVALRIILEHPVFGVGANNSPLLMSQYIPWYLTDMWVARIHNKYLLVGAETGLLGLGTFLWFLLATIRRGWHTWKRNEDRFLALTALGLSTALIGVMFQMLVEPFSSNTRPSIQMVWLIAGLLTAVSRIQDSHVARKRHVPTMPGKATPPHVSVWSSPGPRTIPAY